MLHFDEYIGLAKLILALAVSLVVLALAVSLAVLALAVSLAVLALAVSLVVLALAVSLIVLALAVLVLSHTRHRRGTNTGEDRTHLPIQYSHNRTRRHVHACIHI